MKEDNFFLISGPCVVEDEHTVMTIAEKMTELTSKWNIPYIFKASYRKANRSSLHSFTGIGDEEALKILGKVKSEFGVKTTTDIHAGSEAAIAAEFVDVIQIPAFLCRQTSLLIAAAETKKQVNIKKGQFMSAEAMKFAVEKVTNTGNKNVALIERGTTFGYQDLVVDFRSVPDMQGLGVPVIVDCTHSQQRPNQTAGVTGGRPDMIGTIAKAAIAVGADGLFIETHTDPGQAKSDGANMLHIKEMPALLEKLVKIREAVVG